MNATKTIVERAQEKIKLEFKKSNLFQFIDILKE